MTDEKKPASSLANLFDDEDMPTMAVDQPEPMIPPEEDSVMLTPNLLDRDSIPEGGPPPTLAVDGAQAAQMPGTSGVAQAPATSGVAQAPATSGVAQAPATSGVAQVPHVVGAPLPAENPPWAQPAPGAATPPPQTQPPPKQKSRLGLVVAIGFVLVALLGGGAGVGAWLYFGAEEVAPPPPTPTADPTAVAGLPVATPDGVPTVPNNTPPVVPVTPTTPEGTPPVASETPPVEPPAETPPATPDAGPMPTETPPVEAPPVEAPPVEAPPVEAPPVEAPPTENPPTENPPTENPPTENPIAPTGPGFAGAIEPLRPRIVACINRERGYTPHTLTFVLMPSEGNIRLANIRQATPPTVARCIVRLVESTPWPADAPPERTIHNFQIIQ